MKINTAEFVKSSTTLKNCPSQGYPEVALAGRSNVGKSSFFNKLVNRKKLARISKTPGRTQTLNYFVLNENIYIVDLPGYGYARVPEKIRISWGPMIEEYLSGREQLRGIFLIVDMRHEPSAQDIQFCEWVRFYGFSFAVVATKCDKIKRGKIHNQLKVISQVLELDEGDILIPFSSETGTGREKVLSVIEDWTY
ncbi:MAG: ribosome biogenesis GTP-binding protein YihA/YsxC [Clostridiales bacterium]|nr:ribosome biogenesis GTP-binding protein YihA/YsxC [Clostridiales bacterium]MCF8022268.1 ribosome biogenesis GTP-binding protein YihA/YsxC [Clostridiales bacterium]